MEGAATKLAKAEAGAEKLRPIVDAESTLRTSGSYSSSLEEVRCFLYAATLFSLPCVRLHVLQHPLAVVSSGIPEQQIERVYRPELFTKRE
jgi:hypothetical protein